ncbi:DUF397 domain-containing protein [Embleya sp. NPDC020886]|uniref:DUF397 domain-containing protein n=1 Tax=Embleya sp. NPDC020886 TaxID=3363980 RepID=UPI0037AF5129
MTTGEWFKSSYSTPANDCVEGTRTSDDAMSIRDSKDPGQGTFRFPSHTWEPFLAALKSDDPSSAEI